MGRSMHGAGRAPSEARRGEGNRRQCPRPLRKPRRGFGPRGITLVETLLAFGLFTLVTAIAWAIFNHAYSGADRMERGFEAAQKLRIASARIARELREASSVFYPVESGQTLTGLGYVNPQGHAIMVFQGDAAGNKVAAPTSAVGTGGKPVVPSVLYRTDMNTKETIVLLDSLYFFRATLHPVKAGLERSFVTINVSALERPREGKTMRLQNQVTKIFLRNLERKAPEG